MDHDKIEQAAYEAPAMAEIGDFAEVTLGWYRRHYIDFGRGYDW